MSMETIKINTVPSSIPQQVIGLSESGSLCRTTLTNLLNENPESKVTGFPMLQNVWYQLVQSTSIQGGSGIVYIWRDWGSGGSVFAQVAFCMPHGNQTYTEVWKPQTVFAFGVLSGLRLRLVKKADKTWRLDVCQPNSSSVTSRIRFVFCNNVTTLGMSEVTLEDTDQVWEYSLADLV